MIGKARAYFSWGDGCVSAFHLPAAYFLAGMPPPREFLERLYARGWQPI
jgi:hypothetical protein